jgi:DNA-binding NarL/FixJ family response regulator/tetratricopeptide (TPR) repeat protein
MAAVAGDTDEDAFAATSEAMSLVPARPPSRFRARLASLHSRCAYVMGNETEAQRLATDALAAARETGASDAAAEARATLALLQRRSGDPAEAAARLLAVAEEAHASGQLAAELRSRYSLAGLYHERGDLERSQHAYEDGARRAAEQGQPWTTFGTEARALAAMLRYVRGDWDGALRATDVMGESPPPVAEALLTAMRMMVLAGRGDGQVTALLPEVRPWWKRDGLAALYSTFAGLEICEQRASAPATRVRAVQDALQLIADVVELTTRLWQSPWQLARIRLSALGIAVLSAAAPDGTSSERAELVAWGERLLADGRTSLAQGLPPGRTLGPEGAAWFARLEAEAARLRWLAGADAPSEHDLVATWERVVDAFDYGDVVEQTRARVRLAGVLHAAGRVTEAAAVAEPARERAAGLGAAPLLGALGSLGGSPGALRPDEPRGLSALTGREREVLDLLVQGRTNREIAGRLYISEKTASVHVSNILAKLGVRSRLEAAALARRDLASS